MVTSLLRPGIDVRAAVGNDCEGILTAEALGFFAELERFFGHRRCALIEQRTRTQAWLEAGNKPDFLPETRGIRESEWSVASIPRDLLDRRVEITGPVDRKVVINALNSVANGFMADFEDSCAPTWRNVIEGQINLRDAVDGSIRFADSVTNKTYALAEKHAVLHVRPRGWHLLEEHLLIDGQPVSAALFDCGMSAYRNAKKLLEKGR